MWSKLRKCLLKRQVGASSHGVARRQPWDKRHLWEAHRWAPRVTGGRGGLRGWVGRCVTLLPALRVVCGCKGHGDASVRQDLHEWNQRCESGPCLPGFLCFAFWPQDEISPHVLVHFIRKHRSHRTTGWSLRNGMVDRFETTDSAEWQSGSRLDARHLWAYSSPRPQRTEPCYLGEEWPGIRRMFLPWIWWKLGMRLQKK